MDLQYLSRRASSLTQQGMAKTHLISSPCVYYHYLCDSIDDRGWGCGYRSLQSLCSWAVTQRQRKPGAVRDEGGEKMKQGESATVKEWVVPSVGEIQDTLVEVGDKPAEFAGSREWIGCFEACLVLDHLFSVACKIVHVSSGVEVVNHVKMLAEHFDSIGSPAMIGGDVDGASKTLIGVLVDQSDLDNTRFLVADPHYVRGGHSERELPRGAAVASEDEYSEDAVLLGDGGVQWHSLDLFQASSFYNFCLPQTPSYHNPKLCNHV